MPRTDGGKTGDGRRLLVERIAVSRYLKRSARLRDLLLYVSGRVLECEAVEIHEQEVGQHVFGRPAAYDTTSDNIVRVHASLLRKRLEQYFAAEGMEEPLLLEIPKGNYAPVFHGRDEVSAALPPKAEMDWRLWTLGALALLFACSTAGLLWMAHAAPDPGRPTVRLFWSVVFPSGHPTDIVLDDAAVGLYQDLSGHSLSLSDYFDRDYLRTLPESAAAAKLDPRAASSIVLRRQASYASASLLWKLFQDAGAGREQASLHFARDYTFHALKANNVVLLGSDRSNPWIEPFEGHLGVRWIYDNVLGVRYPVDTWAGAAERGRYRPAQPGEPRESYGLVALLPNLGGSGNVLIVSGTGGSAINTTADSLANERFMAELRRRLPSAARNRFPNFEALIRIQGRGSQPAGARIVICRPPRG
ncbi:MAG: hypothetical protein ABI165_02210 [Bryobacteraceae bacterium]